VEFRCNKEATRLDHKRFKIEDVKNYYELRKKFFSLNPKDAAL